MNEFKIKKHVLMDGIRINRNLMGHLYIAALTRTLMGEDLGKFLKDINWDGKEEIECYMVVEGHKIPIDKVCEEWDKQGDEMIKKAALELVKDKLRDLDDTLYELNKEIKSAVCKKLDLKLGEYDE